MKMLKTTNSRRKVQYFLQKDGRFVISNYDLAKPFASFFPGIAGLFGIPMWVFYVNRGQGIVSFGTQNKDHAICEFFPANRAWQIVSTQGFRTFLKIKSKNKTINYEPFQNSSANDNFDLERKMFISAYDFSLKEKNYSLGLATDVEYFTLSNEPLACLIRKVTIKNTSRSNKKFEIVDGLPQIVAYGVNNKFLKELGRTIQAWMQVEFLTRFRLPFYKISVDPTDRPQVIYIKGGNFYYNFYLKKSKQKKSSFIVDPEEIFGPVTDFNYPQRFFAKGFNVSKKQSTPNKSPAAFGHCKVALNAQEQVCIISMIGYAQDEKHLKTLIQKTQNTDFLPRKFTDYKESIEKLQNFIFTASGDSTYNLYCQQTYLDNILRGGFPLTLKAKDKTHITHVFSRKHGDLERDYNNFLTQATYLSQGNGNYRDVNQNRRNDVWFNPQVKDHNVVSFFNLLQLDGFNPLVVIGTQFKLSDEKYLRRTLIQFVKRSNLEKIVNFSKKQFVPGNLFIFLEENNIPLKISKEKFLEIILSACDRKETAEHGDGFWIDHWTYNIDALESYLAIYPEKLRELLISKRTFIFFNNLVKVKPRDEKYVLFDGRARQYRAVTIEGIEEGSALSGKLKNRDWAVRTEHGKGKIYKTTLLVKIICLIVNKMASFDPFGCGIEMESNKPGWYDALNGLPGLFGSSVCEMMELKRLIDFTSNALEELELNKDYKILIPEELHEFLIAVNKLIADNFKRKKVNKDLNFWQKTYAHKESYRKKTREGLSGREKKLTLVALQTIFKNMKNKVTRSLKKTRDKKSGLNHTYFINDVIKHEKIKDKKKGGFKISKDGLYCIRPKNFKQKPLPLFLEAQVHALRLAADRNKAKTIYENTKKSPLYDKELKMFKVNASLDEVSYEVGRARVFTPGWLENESIWLHMEYKFLLELLRTELYDEFFSEFKNILIPFQPPSRYGRSILENSSFLVSSAYPDKSLHGNGFVARLSGSTAEFINMWLWMNIGKKPFKNTKNGKLALAFKPILPAWLFTKRRESFAYYLPSGKKAEIKIGKNCYAFNFLGSVLVVYHNHKMKNTYGKKGVKPAHLYLHNRKGGKIKIKGSLICSPYAQQVRTGEIIRIDVVLA